jgi:hypothetical protein
MSKLLTPSIELLKEINDNPDGFECKFDTESVWHCCSETRTSSLLAWACGSTSVQIRRKAWTPEIGKIIAVRDRDDEPWVSGTFDSISDGGYYIVDGYRWNQARPIDPSELSK